MSELKFKPLHIQYLFYFNETDFHDCLCIDANIHQKNKSEKIKHLNETASASSVNQVFIIYDPYLN